MKISILNALRFLIIAVFLLNLNTTLTSAEGTSVSFLDLENNSNDVDNFAGVRIVVFYYVSCHSCIEELPILKEIDANYNVTFFMIHYFEYSNNQTILNFIEDHSLPAYWIYGYITEETKENFQIEYTPTLIILDDVGRIAADILGVTSYKFLEHSVVNALEQNTDDYFTDRREDSGGYADVVFIAIGVIVSAVVIYFLIKSFPKKRGENKKTS